MSAKGTPPARLAVLLARQASVAAVFRRGPSKWTLLSKWNTRTDAFSDGDWYHGSIYPRRSDLSPDGRYLIYFAAFARQARFRVPSQSWTGVSEIPSLQPIARWLKEDCWAGGGLFETSRDIRVNDRLGDPQRIAGGFRVSFDNEAHGEDEPVYGHRLTRDGWVVEQEWVIEYAQGGYSTSVPEVRRKRHGRLALTMTRSLAGFEWREIYAVHKGSDSSELAGATWADFDQRGRIVLVCDGCLLEVVPKGSSLERRVIRDFNGLVPPADELAGVGRSSAAQG